MYLWCNSGLSFLSEYEARHWTSTPVLIKATIRITKQQQYIHKFITNKTKSWTTRNPTKTGDENNQFLLLLHDKCHHRAMQKKTRTLLNTRTHLIVVHCICCIQKLPILPNNLGASSVFCAILFFILSNYMSILWWPKSMFGWSFYTPICFVWSLCFYVICIYVYWCSSMFLWVSCCSIFRFVFLCSAL